MGSAGAFGRAGEGIELQLAARIVQGYEEVAQGVHADQTVDVVQGRSAVIGKPVFVDGHGAVVELETADPDGFRIGAMCFGSAFAPETAYAEVVGVLESCPGRCASAENQARGARIDLEMRRVLLDLHVQTCGAHMPVVAHEWEQRDFGRRGIRGSERAGALVRRRFLLQVGEIVLPALLGSCIEIGFGHPRLHGCDALRDGERAEIFGECVGVTRSQLMGHGVMLRCCAPHGNVREQPALQEMRVRVTGVIGQGAGDSVFGVPGASLEQLGFCQDCFKNGRMGFRRYGPGEDRVGFAGLLLVEVGFGQGRVDRGVFRVREQCFLVNRDGIDSFALLEGCVGVGQPGVGKSGLPGLPEQETANAGSALSVKAMHAN